MTRLLHIDCKYVKNVYLIKSIPFIYCCWFFISTHCSYFISQVKKKMFSFCRFLLIFGSFSFEIIKKKKDKSGLWCVDIFSMEDVHTRVCVYTRAKPIRSKLNENFQNNNAKHNFNSFTSFDRSMFFFFRSIHYNFKLNRSDHDYLYWLKGRQS